MEHSISDRNNRVATLAMYIAMAVVLHWMESFIPRPAPFIRLGLANIFTLCAIYLFGGWWGLVLVLSRVLIASLISGSILTLGFILSITGGTVAGIVMWLMPKKWFSLVGVSVAGAVSHISTQLIVASYLIVKHTTLLNLIPLFILISILTGILNGYLAGLVLSVSGSYNDVQKFR